MNRIREELDSFLTDEAIIRDVKNMLDSEGAPGRVIFPKKGAFPVDGELSIVLKQFSDWRCDITTPFLQFVTVIVALGTVTEGADVLGGAKADYGFVTLRYDSTGRRYSDDWDTVLFREELDDEDDEIED